MTSGGRPATAFVASLLPAAFLVKYADHFNVTRIIVTSAIHEAAFAHVAARLNGVAVQRLRGGAFSQAISLLRIVLGIRIRGQRVLFFHECCWPALDLAIDIARPQGWFFPRVTLASFDEIGFAELPVVAGWAQKIQRRAIWLLRRRFRFFKTYQDSSTEGFVHRLAYRRYPSTIETNDVGAEPIVTDTRRSSNARGSRQIIIVAATEPVPDDEQRQLYRAIAEVAAAEGYGVAFKDHPTSPLGFAAAGVQVIDSTIPIELLADDFDVAVGVASTGLLSVGDRKVSILEMLPSMAPAVRQSRREHLSALRGGDRILYVQNLDELRLLLSRRDANIAESR